MTNLIIFIIVILIFITKDFREEVGFFIWFNWILLASVVLSILFW